MGNHSDLAKGGNKYWENINGDEQVFDSSMRHVFPDVKASHIQRKYRDVAYADRSKSKKLDIYLPDKGDGTFPVIVFIHGGAWCMGDKGDMQVKPFMMLLQDGYAVVSVNYRLTGEKGFPAGLMDCKTAVRFLKANAEKYHLDADRIGLAGDSAGANIVLMIGATVNHPELSDLTLGYADWNTRVKCIVSWYAPTDIAKMYEQLRETGLNYISEDDPTTYEARYVGGSMNSVPAEIVNLASPIYHINTDMPPILLQHGYKDRLVPYQQSETFYEKAVKIVGKEHITLELFENAGHADLRFETAKNMERIRAFFDKYLKDME